jgi:uncharacterized RDD family membrane protein YckC
VLFSLRSLLTGVGASAAQNAPVTKTCLQCGAVLPFSVRACNFCDSSFSSSTSCYGDTSATPPSKTQQQNAAPPCLAVSSPEDGLLVADDTEEAAPWRGELSLRMAAYRARKRRRPANTAQPQLPFECPDAPARVHTVALEEGSRTPADDFSFTVAIGRNAEARARADGRMEIDVSAAPPRAENPGEQPLDGTETYGSYPVASLEERRSAAAIDIACLLFAYGAFLALFGSLGGQFTLSKLSAAVYGVTFSIVYLQYFALFTIFGGTTPGMMFRGLQVASFTGDPPTPRQMLLRSLGYILSAGTLFLGFFWAWWDEDALTWHDRLSHTYLSVLQTHDDLKSSVMAPSHPR